MKWMTILVLAVFGALLFYGMTALPARGDPNAPSNAYVSPTYLERSFEDTHTPNVVTSVLADYRGYDTLGETTVIFTAGLACLFILRKGAGDERSPR